MSQKEKECASLMVKAYNWLMEFHKTHQNFTFKVATNNTKSPGQYLFPIGHKGWFYIDLARDANSSLSLDFYMEGESLAKVKCSMDTGDDLSYLELAEKLGAKTRKNPSVQIVPIAKENVTEVEIHDKLLSWLERNYEALHNALGDKKLSPEDFKEKTQKRLAELCEGGWLERTENGSYFVPSTAIFSGSEDSEDKDDMLEKGKKGEMNKLKKELNEFVYDALKGKFVYDALKGKENFEAYLCKPDEELSSKKSFDIAGNRSSALSIKLNADVILGLYSDGKKTELRDKLDLPIKVEKDGTYGLVGEMKVKVPNSGHDGFVFYMDTGVKLSSLRNPESEDAKIDAMTKIAEETGKVLGVLIEKRAISAPSRKEKTAGDSNGQKKEQNDMVSRLVEMVEASKNVVLTGAPGTGKTYTAKKIAIALSKDEWVVETDSEGRQKGKWKYGRIASVQFHPGYDYSDFVIGMKPVLVDESGTEVEQAKSKNGKLQVSFRWKDGVFKEFADRAKKEFDAAEDKENAPKFVFLIDEINRADLSRVFGELFSLLEEEYRYPGENATSILLPDGKDFVIPKNLYIIGTMNDIDRSVESMDFALRRRFAWREVKASETMDAILGTEKNPKPKIDPGSASKLKAAMEALNERISGAKVLECSSKDGKENSKENINIGAFLGPAYELGAAIFAKFAKCNGDFNMLWENHIKIILAEYLRGRRNPEKLLDALNDVYDKAVNDEEASR